MAHGQEIPFCCFDLRLAEAGAPAGADHLSSGDEVIAQLRCRHEIHGRADGDAGLLAQSGQGHAAGVVGQGEQDAAVGPAQAVQALRLQIQLNPGGALPDVADHDVVVLGIGLPRVEIVQKFGFQFRFHVLSLITDSILFW